MIGSLLVSIHAAAFVSMHAPHGDPAGEDEHGHGLVVHDAPGHDAPGAMSTGCGLTQPTEPKAGGVSYDCTQRQDTGYDAGTAFDIFVVTMDGEPVELDTANAYWVMREAAALDGVDIRINSGFRTMEEQEYFYMCYTCCCCNSCNLAAAPGYSNHQSGHALDLNTSAPGVYAWLAEHGAEYGFSETVPSEDWHWEWWGGGPGGGVCNIAAPPTGTVDATACEGIAGWAQDPDTPDAAIDVRVSFGAPEGDPAAVTVSVTADDERDDLCEALGSCAHGFALEIPRLLQDDVARAVHVVAIDSEGEANATIAGGDAMVQCPRPPLPEGVRRAVDPTTLAAWRFDLLWDAMRADAAELAGFEDGEALPGVALIVRDSADESLWWVDDGWRRAIDEATAVAWRIDPASAQSVGPEIVAQWREGPPMRARPELVTDGVAVYLIDDPPAEGMGQGDDGDGGVDDGTDDGGTDDGSDDAGGGGGAAVPDAGDASSGCGCAADRDRGAWWLLAVVGVAIARRRRTRASRVA
jgi:MYXO-CTERM domain-containing protein